MRPAGPSSTPRSPQPSSRPCARTGRSSVRTPSRRSAGPCATSSSVPDRCSRCSTTPTSPTCWSTARRTCGSNDADGSPARRSTSVAPRTCGRSRSGSRRAGGQRLDDASPTVDARLPDGTRLHAVLPPVAPRSPLLSLRVVRTRAFTLDELVAAGTLAPGLVAVLRALLAARANLLVSGATGSGKTTLLASMLSARAARRADRRHRGGRARSGPRTRTSSVCSPGTRTSTGPGGSSSPTWSGRPCGCDRTASCSASAAGPRSGRSWPR